MRRSIILFNIFASVATLTHGVTTPNGSSADAVHLRRETGHGSELFQELKIRPCDASDPYFRSEDPEEPLPRELQELCKGIAPVLDRRPNDYPLVFYGALVSYPQLFTFHLPLFTTSPVLSKIDNEKEAKKHFLVYQDEHILDEAQMELAEKSIRIGWTYSDAFKNVRKRVRHAKRDYLFQTKDEKTAVEYVEQCYKFAEIYNMTKAIVSHGVENWELERFDFDGRATGFTDEVKVGVIKFDNKSRILAFSSNPNAMRAFGGDVGLDEFAFHKSPEALWASASGRATWGYNINVWSSHNGDSTLFNQFVREAKAGTGGWSFHRVDIYDAIEAGLVEKINQERGTNVTREAFLAGCKQRSRLPEVFAQEYECNPRGGMDSIVPWSVVQACLCDVKIERAHLEAKDIITRFGEYRTETKESRERAIIQWMQQVFARTFSKTTKYRCGFDIAASGQGDLASFWIDDVVGEQATLAALLTCRTEDWEFLKVAARTFMTLLSDARMCGDETGLGRQICWEMSKLFPGRFVGVNFGSCKSDMGVALLNQLTTLNKRMPRDKEHQDIAADVYAMRKSIAGSKVVFSEGSNPFNPSSHCDIAWSGALAEKARTENIATYSATIC